MNDHFKGWDGKRRQVWRSEELPRLESDILATQRQMALLQEEHEALQSRDPDKALSVLSKINQLRQQIQGAQAHQESLTAWGEAEQHFHRLRENPELRAVARRLAGKQYDPDPVKSALGFWKDLAQETVAELDAIKSQIRKDLEPAIRKEELGKRFGNEPQPDLNGGGPPGRASSDDEFLVLYGRGDSNDHTRARKLLGV